MIGAKFSGMYILLSALCICVKSVVTEDHNRGSSTNIILSFPAQPTGQGEDFHTAVAK